MKIRLLVLALLITTSAGADTLTSNFNLSITHSLTRVHGARTLRDAGRFDALVGFADGTATDSAEADKVFSDRQTITSATPAIYDLAALTGSFGDSLSFSGVKVFALKNLSETGYLTIGGGETPWLMGASTDALITIAPLGAHISLAPLGGIVASGTGLQIITDSVASFDLILIGY